MASQMRAFFDECPRVLWLLAIALSFGASAATPSGQFLDIQPELASDPDRPGATEMMK